MNAKPDRQHDVVGHARGVLVLVIGVASEKRCLAAGERATTVDVTKRAKLVLQFAHVDSRQLVARYRTLERIRRHDSFVECQRAARQKAFDAVKVGVLHARRREDAVCVIGRTDDANVAEFLQRLVAQ